MRKIFISYSSADRQFVNRLARDLAALGFPVWYDQWELNVGDSLVEGIQNSIQTAACVIVVLSPSSVESKWVKQELRQALIEQIDTSRVFILPVFLRDCELPGFLRDRLFADFRVSYSRGFSRLVSSVRLQLASESYYRSGAYRAAVYNSYPPMPRPIDFDAIEKYSDMASLLTTLPGLWRGATGRLRLELDAEAIKGQYDWTGYEYSGVLVGTLKERVIQFAWSWSISGERGNGLFYYHLPGVLFGGWWFDSEPVDIEDMVSRDEIPPNRWGFYRDSGRGAAPRFEANSPNPASAPDG